VLLFHADGFGSGGDDSCVLSVYHPGPMIDFAQVTKLSFTNLPNSVCRPVSQNGALPFQTSPTAISDGGKNGKVMSSTGAIVGIALSAFVVPQCCRLCCLWYVVPFFDFVVVLPSSPFIW
jgi:hypothetical protein